MSQDHQETACDHHRRLTIGVVARFASQSRGRPCVGSDKRVVCLS